MTVRPRICTGNRAARRAMKVTVHKALLRLLPPPEREMLREALGGGGGGGFGGGFGGDFGGFGGGYKVIGLVSVFEKIVEISGGNIGLRRGYFICRSTFSECLHCCFSRIFGPLFGFFNHQLQV